MEKIGSRSISEELSRVLAMGSAWICSPCQNPESVVDCFMAWLDASSTRTYPDRIFPCECEHTSNRLVSCYVFHRGHVMNRANGSVRSSFCAGGCSTNKTGL
jgi:hypothetical protein